MLLARWAQGGCGTKAEAVREATERLLEGLAQAIGARILARKGRIATMGAWDPKTDQTTPNFRVDPAILGAEPTEFHGQRRR